MTTATKQDAQMNVETMAAMMQEMQKSIELLKQENQVLKVASTTAPKKERKRIIKTNAKGGLFITDPKFLCFSEAKQKEYVGSMNIHAYQLGMFQLILEDDNFRNEILSFMKQ